MGKGKAKPKPATLASAGMYPMLSKTAVAIGKDTHVPGAFWTGCSEADKKKIYKCIVVEFEAMHTFGAGRKGAGFRVKECTLHVAWLAKRLMARPTARSQKLSMELRCERCGMERRTSFTVQVGTGSCSATHSPGERQIGL